MTSDRRQLVHDLNEAKIELELLRQRHLLRLYRDRERRAADAERHRLAAMTDGEVVREEAARILASLPLDPDAHAHRLALTEDA
jgi:hypothetical protein